MKIRDIIVEADPAKLGPMNREMEKVLRQVHTGDVEQAQADAEAQAKAKADQRAEAARLRKENPEMLQQYIDMLKNHDWTYEYSDGYSRQYTDGRDEHYAIMRMAKKIDPDLEIYNKYDPLNKEGLGENVSSAFATSMGGGNGFVNGIGTTQRRGKSPRKKINQKNKKS